MARTTNSHSNDSEQNGTAVDWPDRMNLRQACKFLGTSKSKLTMLVRSGLLKYEENPLDYRMKLVKRTDLEKLKIESTGRSDEQ